MILEVPLSDIAKCIANLGQIPPAGDFRPYLHIHDHDFALLVNSSKPQPGVVVGVTNPVFRNAASHWPNVISISADRPKRTPVNGTASPRPEAPDGFLSRRHRSVLKDRALLKRLEELVSEGKLNEPAANDAVRSHFQQLTERFLVPLNRYLQTLVPTFSTRSGLPRSTCLSAMPNGPGIKPFSLPAFLTHLRTTGPNPLSFRTKGLSTKSRVENDFYESFCRSASFPGWLNARMSSLGDAVAQRAALSAMPPALNLGVDDETRMSSEGDGSSVGEWDERGSSDVGTEVRRGSLR